MINEEELLTQSANAPVIYVDGFACYRRCNGVLRCVGYVHGTGAQLNLIISLSGADAANRATRKALDEAPTKTLTIWSEGATAH